MFVSMCECVCVRAHLCEVCALLSAQTVGAGWVDLFD